MENSKIPQFSILMVIEIGVHKSLDALVKALEKFNCARGILKTPFTLSQVQEEILICIATVFQLTGKNNATTMEIYRSLQLIGTLCIPEDALALRVQYPHQEEDERLRVAMEPIKVFGEEFPVILSLINHKGSLLLSTIPAGPDYEWSGEDKFAFRGFTEHQTVSQQGKAA